MSSAGDRELLERLSDLALVDLDGLLAGADEAGTVALLAALADDLQDALRCARQRAADLIEQMRAADPLGWAKAGRDLRMQSGGHELEGRAVAQLAGRAQAAMALARLDELAARVAPRLFEVDRRLGRRSGPQQ